MAKVPPEAIELPAYDGLHAMASHVSYELVERGSTVLRAAHAVVGVLDGTPAARCDIAAELDQLVLGGLVESAHAGVERSRLRQGETTNSNLRSLVPDVKGTSSSPESQGIKS